MGSAMNQEEFDRRMAEHTVHRLSVGGTKQTFRNEDLTGLDINNHNLSDVAFVGCRLGDLRLKGNESKSTTLSNCEIGEVDVTAGGVYHLFLFNCRVANLKVKDATYAHISLIECELGPTSISSSSLNLTSYRCLFTHGTHIKECTGTVEIVDRRSLSYLSIVNNSFDDLNLRGSGVMGIITTPLWDVHYCADMMRIGCQQHAISAWRNFSDTHIQHMDAEALEWWKQWKDVIFFAIEKSAHTYVHLADQIKRLRSDTAGFKSEADRVFGITPESVTLPTEGQE